MPLGIWLYHIMMLFVSIGQGSLITDGWNSNKMFFLPIIIRKDTLGLIFKRVEFSGFRVSFGILGKSTELKVTSSFCFANKIPYNVTATNTERGNCKTILLKKRPWIIFHQTKSINSALTVHTT